MIAPAKSQPVVLGYMRCSDESSLEYGNGLAHHEMMVTTYVSNLKVQHPDLYWDRQDCLYVDLGVSGRTPLITRSEGCRMNARLKRGDHVVLAAFVRAFRNQRDQFETVAQWQERGVTVHFADQRFDLSTAMGRFVFNLLGLINQLEAENVSERVKASCRSRAASLNLTPEARKLGAASRLPEGWSWIRDENGDRAVQADPQWADVRQYVYERRESGSSWGRIAEEIKTLPRFAVSPLREKLLKNTKTVATMDLLLRVYNNWLDRDRIAEHVGQKCKLLLQNDARRSARLLERYGAVAEAYTRKGK